MLKTGILLWTMSFATASALHADQVIELEKLSKAQLNETLIEAPDDAIIEFHGVNKTKAQWRSAFQADHQPSEVAKLKESLDERDAKYEAAAKALQVEQDGYIAEQNARVTKEFNEFKSR
jgi:nitrate reductase assembly molybdenum cofactor insertion protein NarJ